MRVLLAALLFASTVSLAQSASVPVEQAEMTGAELFTAISSKDFATSQDIKNFDALQRALDAQRCPGTTLSLILLPDRQHAYQVFAIAGVPDGGKLVVGRHFKTTVHDGTADVVALAASTKSCLILTISPQAAALMTTEVISPTPTEFHVLETKLHNIPLYVGAGGQVWAVKDGSIHKVEKGT
jgi:hypothetical protein